MTEFGSHPQQAIFNFTKDGDFFQPITTADGTDWPDTAAIAISIDGAESGDAAKFWPASIVGDTATWAVDKAIVNALEPGTRHSVRVVYTDASNADIVWWKGPVRWYV